MQSSVVAPLDEFGCMMSDDTKSTTLTPKQQRFADEYLIDLNATAAYKRAGYVVEGNVAESAASRLLSNVKVAKYVQEAMDKRSADLGIDAKYVLNTIFETVERCKQARPVLDRKGEPVMVVIGEGDDASIAPAYTFDAGSVLKGAELIGKHLKMFTDKSEVEHSGGLTVEIVRFGTPKQ